MREIKFRAWDIPGKFYFPVDTIEFLAGGIKANGPSYGEGWATVNKGFEDYCDITIVLEQFTGLKDKNGVEIYEGDLVMATSIYGWTTPRSVNEFGLNIRSISAKSFEVIGNIHEELKGE